jgi:hypothetical protein
MKNIISMARKLFLILAFFLNVGLLSAQTFEIRAVRVDAAPGTIGVEMRVTSGPPPTTSDQVTDIVFGIKWSDTYNVDLVTSSISTQYNIQKSGTRVQKNGFHFQAFAASNIPFSVPSNWTVNEWMPIMTIQNNQAGTGFGTFEIAEPGFDATTNPNIGINLVDFTPVINGRAELVSLPLEFKKFEVTTSRKTMKLKWLTLNERNNKGFEVQRAADDGGNFQKIGWVDSKVSNSRNNEYSFTDNHVASNVRYHYRLKQIDIDEKFMFSEVRTAIMRGFDDDFIRVHPNPADKILQISFDNIDETPEVILSVLDSKGASMLRRNYKLLPAKKIELDISSLISGQYFLIIKDANGLSYSKAFQKK